MRYIRSSRGCHAKRPPGDTRTPAAGQDPVGRRAALRAPGIRSAVTPVPGGAVAARHRAPGWLGLRVDAMPGRHLHGAVAGRAAEDDLTERDVVAGRGLVQNLLRVGGYLDVVGAVGHVGDVERLAGDVLLVGVVPADRQLLGDPHGAGRAAIAEKAGEGRLPEGVRDQQVDRVHRRDAEADLVAEHHQRLVRVEQRVAGELLEVPVVVAVLVVEAHRAGPGPADHVPVPPEYWYAFMTGDPF